MGKEASHIVSEFDGPTRQVILCTPNLHANESCPTAFQLPAAAEINNALKYISNCYQIFEILSKVFTPLSNQLCNVRHVYHSRIEPRGGS